MPNTIVPPPAIVLPFSSTSHTFTVGRVWCVGRNYAAHAREMGGDPDREPPFFFSKPANTVVWAGCGDRAAAIAYPPATGDLHHEVELVLALGAGGRNLSLAQACACVAGMAVGIDLTRRDLQATFKKAGLPWELAKGFDGSAICGTLTAITCSALEADNPEIGLEVNGVVRQQGTVDEMIWSVPELLQHLSRLITLQPGDLVYTGTPSGVGPLVVGDRTSCHIRGLPAIELLINPALREG